MAPTLLSRSITISIHVPREGDDISASSMAISRRRFQSTSPVRGTTLRSVVMRAAVVISIHVPREGDDAKQGSAGGSHIGFQSTSPVRGTTTGHIRRTRHQAFQSTSPVRGTTW